MKRTTITFATALLTGLLLLGCGGPTSSTPAASSSQAFADSLVGYWVIPGAPGQQCLEVRLVGSAYAVGWNGGPAAPVSRKNGRLVLLEGYWKMSGDTGTGSPTVELDYRNGHAVLYTINPEDGVTYDSVSLRRLTKSSYAAAATTFSDQHTVEFVDYLAAEVSLWAKRHEGHPPTEDQMNPGSAFGKYVSQSGAFGWPMNPFQRRPMRVGSDPGDFSYTTNGITFELVGHLSGGRDYASR